VARPQTPRTITRIVLTASHAPPSEVQAAMSAVTLVRPAHLQVVPPLRAVERAAARLSDAVAEYDAALDEGASMHVLVRLDQEVAAATRGYRTALAEQAHSA
jgi:hypothetical protein